MSKFYSRLISDRPALFAHLYEFPVFKPVEIEADARRIVHGVFPPTLHIAAHRANGKKHLPVGFGDLLRNEIEAFRTFERHLLDFFEIG